MFGGVFDEDEGELLKSTFFDEIHAINLDRLSWYPIHVAAPPPAALPTPVESVAEPEPEQQTDDAVPASQEQAAAAQALAWSLSGLWVATGEYAGPQPGQMLPTEDELLLALSPVDDMGSTASTSAGEGRGSRRCSAIAF